MSRSLKVRIADAPTPERRVQIAASWVNDWRLRVQSDYLEVETHAKRNAIESALTRLHYLHQDTFKGFDALRGFLPLFGLVPSAVQRILYEWIGNSDKAFKRIEGLLSDGDIPQAIDDLRAFAKYTEAQQFGLLDILNKS